MPGRLGSLTGGTRTEHRLNITVHNRSFGLLEHLLVRNRSVIVLSAITLAAFVLGGFNLLEHGMWSDEAYSLLFATSPNFSDAIHRLDGPIVAYYALLRVWFAIVPPSLGSGRLFSLAFAVVSIPLVYALGRRLYTNGVGIISAILLACNSLLWSYAADVRVYTLAIALSLVSYLLFVNDSWTLRLKASGLANIVLFCLQMLYGTSTFVAQCATAVYVKTTTRRLALMIAFNVAGFSAAAIAFHFLGSTYSSWIAPISLSSVLAQMPKTFFLFAVFAAIAFWGGKIEAADKRVMLLFWFLAPVVTALLVSLVKPAFLNRYFLNALPPLLILAAVGISRLEHLVGKYAVVAVLALLELSATWQINGQPHEDWRKATARLESLLRPGDTIIASPDDAAVGLRAQLQENHYPRLPVRVFPRLSKWYLQTGRSSDYRRAHLGATVWIMSKTAGARIALPRGYARCQSLATRDNSITILKFKKHCAG